MSEISILFYNDRIKASGIQLVSDSHDFMLANNDRKEGEA